MRSIHVAGVQISLYNNDPNSCHPLYTVLKIAAPRQNLFRRSDGQNLGGPNFLTRILRRPQTVVNTVTAPKPLRRKYVLTRILNECRMKPQTVEKTVTAPKPLRHKYALTRIPRRKYVPPVLPVNLSSHTSCDPPLHLRSYPPAPREENLLTQRPSNTLPFSPWQTTCRIFPMLVASTRCAT